MGPVVQRVSESVRFAGENQGKVGGGGFLRVSVIVLQAIPWRGLRKLTRHTSWWAVRAPVALAGLDNKVVLGEIA